MAETVRCRSHDGVGVAREDERIRQVGGAGQAKVMGKGFYGLWGKTTNHLYSGSGDTETVVGMGLQSWVSPVVAREDDSRRSNPVCHL